MSTPVAKPSSRSASCRRSRRALVSLLLALTLLLAACRPATFDEDDLITDVPPTETTETDSTETESQTTATDTDAVTTPGTEEETSEETSPTTEETSEETTRQTTVAPTATPSPSPTPRPTSTPTPSPTPTSTPTPSPAPEPAGSFPHRNFGAFFRDQYGSNSQVTSEGGISVDTGSTAQGVVLVRIGSDAISSGTRSKAAFMDSSNRVLYQYDITVRDRYIGLPLNMGNGSYRLMVLEHVGGSDYTPKLTHDFSVSLASSLKPYTAANIFVDFSRSSAAVQRANSLTSGIDTTDGKVSAVYRWITQNISYDRGLASSIQSGQIVTHLPNPDRTMSTRTGICFDYASLMAAMLRSQGIPTRLSVGNTSHGYHAWNEVYFEGRGWVVVAEFRWRQVDGTAWVLFDSTFSAGGMSPQDIQSTSYSRDRVY